MHKRIPCLGCHVSSIYAETIFINMIRLSNLIAEAVTIGGVQLKPANPAGGPIQAIWDGNVATYRVRVKSPFYTGPVAVTSIWQTRDGAIRIADNTGKTWSATRTDIGQIVRNIRTNTAQITVSKTAADITLTRV
jgi:hypothetical protein